MSRKTNLTSQPLVCVITPVYNGKQYMAKCIESVLNQTYSNWEYVIVDNCSTDGTKELAAKYAEADKRIRIVDNDSFLTSLQNQNNALKMMSPESKYCKILHADDWLFPECIEKMVELSEDHPNVGIVSSYILSDNTVLGSGLPYTETVMPGTVPCKLWLVEGRYLFGNPSSLLIRSDLIRNRKLLYDETYLNTDQIACFELLKYSDFGFIHQILSYMRIHEEQVSSLTVICKTKALDKLILLEKYGSIHLTKEEERRCKKAIWQQYYRHVGQNILTINKKECLEYHRDCLERLGYSINKVMFKSVLLRIYGILKKPFVKIGVIKK
jgi:glycosyltransferase involved in cell wall biosynthesis